MIVAVAVVSMIAAIVVMIVIIKMIFTIIAIILMIVTNNKDIHETNDNILDRSKNNDTNDTNSNILMAMRIAKVWGTPTAQSESDTGSLG